jgi:hypothetical protein
MIHTLAISRDVPAYLLVTELYTYSLDTYTYTLTPTLQQLWWLTKKWRNKPTDSFFPDYNNWIIQKQTAL